MFTPPLTLQNKKRQKESLAIVAQQKNLQQSEKSIFTPNPGGQQKAFDLLSQESQEFKWLWVKGGLGSGKSFLGSHFIVSRAIKDPESRSLITANSYGQLETSTLPAFVSFCFKYGHDIYPRAETVDLTARKIAQNRYCLIHGCYVIVRTAEIFLGRTTSSTEAGRGMQVRSIWFDEGTYSKKGAFITMGGRLGRGEGYLKGLGLITSSINKNNPYNWTYELFDDPDRDEKLHELHRTVKIATSENAQYLDDDYESSYRATLTTELAKIELEGEYAQVNSGRIFSYFNRNQHVIPFKLFIGRRFLVSFDFNYNPATAIIGADTGSGLILNHEFYLANSTTFKLADEVCKWIIANAPKNCVVNVFGDASGASHSANSNLTNWDIVIKAFNRYNILYNFCVPKANPSVVDTVNAVNALLMRDELKVANTCKNTIRDLEFLLWKEGSNPPKIDKSDLALSHCGDNVRYMVQGTYPIAAPPRPKMGTFIY